MKVAHASDHITHAIIGGKKAVNFGISDDPAFFQILSKSLYKDPLLAMIREIICNAWDIHIEGGITDKAIEVTVSDEYITVKDYGIGIHDDLIAPVYGIYGASTKKNDGRQTGGFGLGCKSPFAYNEHFEVTSAHEGTKTIYKMSRSSGELEGKPSITPIANFPTTETGITVKIPINPADRMNHLIPWHVRNVVFNGDIKATLNQEELPTLGLEETEFGLVMLTDDDMQLTRHIKSRISVRYGNVIYPVENTEHWSELYNKVNSLLANHYHCKLIMLAPPDSISITPSRESLTNSDITVETINKLLVKFLGVFLKNQSLLFRHKELVNEYIDAAAKEVENTELHIVHKLPLGNWHIPGVPQRAGMHMLKSTEDFAKMDVTLRYNSSKRLGAKQFLKHIQRYFYKILDIKPESLDKGLLQHWARTFQKNITDLRSPEEYNPHNYYEEPVRHKTYVKASWNQLAAAPKKKRVQSGEKYTATLWWQKKILYPLTKKLSVIPGFERNRLFYYNRNHNVTDNRYGTPAAVRVGSVRLNNHTHNLVHLITPTVILCHAAELLPQRIRGISTKNAIGTKQAEVYFIYEVPRKEADAETVKEAFKLIDGIEVLDFTGRTEIEQEAYDERQAKILLSKQRVAAGKTPIVSLPKKVRKGMIRLDVVWNKDRGCINTMQFTDNKDPDRVIKPEAVALISTAQEYRHQIDRLDVEISEKIVKLYGSVIATSNRSDFIADVSKKDPSIMQLRPYIFDKISDAVQNSPTLVSYRECTINKIEQYITENASWAISRHAIRIIGLMIDYPELNHLVPDIQILSDEDKMRWYLWEHMGEISYSKRDEIRKIRDEIHVVPLKKEIKDFLDTKIIGNSFLGLIDDDAVPLLMRNVSQDPVQTQKLIELLTVILK